MGREHEAGDWRLPDGFAQDAARRDRRVQPRADGPTKAFVEYAKAQPLLKAVLCGHTHFFWEERLSPTAVEIVCPGTYAGEALELRLA